MTKDTEFKLVDVLKRLVRQAILYSKQAHDAVFTEKRNLPASLAYLQRASAKMSAGEALYWAQYEILARDETEKIFLQFDIFADELVENFATKHSQQWTDIQFIKLMDLVDNSAFALQNV